MADQKPTMCVVAGPNGSGKTTTTELLLANEWGANSLYINPDNIAEQFPDNEKYDFDWDTLQTDSNRFQSFLFV